MLYKYSSKKNGESLDFPRHFLALRPGNIPLQRIIHVEFDPIISHS